MRSLKVASFHVSPVLTDRSPKKIERSLAPPALCICTEIKPPRIPKGARPPRAHRAQSPNRPKCRRTPARHMHNKWNHGEHRKAPAYSIDRDRSVEKRDVKSRQLTLCTKIDAHAPTHCADVEPKEKQPRPKEALYLMRGRQFCRVRAYEKVQYENRGSLVRGIPMPLR